MIGVSTEESHTVECYRIKYGECSFILVRIGCNEGTVGEVDISELVTDTELPVLAVVHGESASTVTKIVSDRGMSRVCGSEDIICYADSGNIYANITAVENAANYRQIRITVDH